MVDIDVFKKEGYYLGKSIIDTDYCDLLIKEVDDLHNELVLHEPEKNGRIQLENSTLLKKIQCSLDISRPMCDLSQHDGIKRIVTTLMNTEDIQIWEDKIHYKPPNVGSDYKWHCDYNNWQDKRTKDNITCMIFLEDGTIENGTLKVIPGSNNEYSKYPSNKDSGLESTFAPGVYNKDIIDGRSTFVESINEDDAIYVNGKKGDILFFDAFIQHKSEHNYSNKSRKVIFFTYSHGKYGNLYLHNILRRNFNAFNPPLGKLPDDISWDKYPINNRLSEMKEIVDIAKNRNTSKTMDYYSNLNQYLDNENKETTLEKIRNFSKYVPRQNLTTFLGHYEIYKEILTTHGCVLEFGVLNGGSLFQWAHFSEILEPTNFLRRVYGFDTFNGFTDIDSEDLKSNSNESQVKKGGFKSHDEQYTDIKKAIGLFDQNRFLGHMKKIDIIKGDVIETLPDFLDKNKELLISLVHMDLDLYKPTKFVLEQILKRMAKGSIIIFDELNHPDYPGETIALLETLNINNCTIKRVPMCAGLSYMIL